MTFQIPAYTNGSGEERERPEDDTHFGRCYGIVDMGTQNGGQYGPKRKLRLLFELSAENSEGERFLVHMEENMVISPKSNIGKAIGAWRGKPLDDSECKGAGFDITKVLGAAGMFTTNVRSTGTAKYTNIVGFAKVPKAVEVAPLIKETVVLFRSRRVGQASWLHAETYSRQPGRHRAGLTSQRRTGPRRGS